MQTARLSHLPRPEAGVATNQILEEDRNGKIFPQTQVLPFYR